VSVRRKGNRWEVRLRIGGGARIERRLPPGATRADALDLEAALRRRAIDTAAGRQPQRLIDEALDRWIETSAKHLRSWRNLSYRINVLREFTRGKYLDDIPAVADAVSKAAALGGAKPATINRNLAIIRRIANLAERWGWTDKPLGRRVQMVAGETPRHVYLTREQVRALARAAGGEAGDAILLAVLTGLRQGELLRLTPDMIRDGCIVLDARTKSGRPRIVPLPPEAARIVARRLPWGLTVDSLRNAWERARDAAGLPGVRFHDLRHCYASFLVQGGASMTTVRDLLGHSSLAVTSRYAHLRRTDLEQAVAGLRMGEVRGKRKTAR
jgi:integrase